MGKNDTLLCIFGLASQLVKLVLIKRFQLSDELREFGNWGVAIGTIGWITMAFSLIPGALSFGLIIIGMGMFLRTLIAHGHGITG